MDFLILAHLGDETVLRVGAALRARHGTERVKLVSGEELALAPYWAHRLEGPRPRTEVRLADGVTLNSEKIGVVFNRLVEFTMPHFARAKEADRDYAAREMTALCLSWLAGLPCPVVNAATPMGLSGQTRSHAEWLLLAGRAGLPVQGYHATTDPRWFRDVTYVPHRWGTGWEAGQPLALERVFPPSGRFPTVYLEAVAEQRESLLVAGERAVGSLEGLYGRRASRLARIAGCELLEVVFAPSPPGRRDWKVCGINLFPHVRSPEAVSAVVELLETKRAEACRESGVAP